MSTSLGLWFGHLTSGFAAMSKHASPADVARSVAPADDAREKPAAKRARVSFEDAISYIHENDSIPMFDSKDTRGGPSRPTQRS